MSSSATPIPRPSGTLTVANLTLLHERPDLGEEDARIHVQTLLMPVWLARTQMLIRDEAMRPRTGSYSTRKRMAVHINTRMLCTWAVKAARLYGLDEYTVGCDELEALGAAVEALDPGFKSSVTIGTEMTVPYLTIAWNWVKPMASTTTQT